MAGRSSTYDLYDDLKFSGRLGERLRNWRSQGLHPPAIAERLFREHGVKASLRTVYRWIERAEGE